MLLSLIACSSDAPAPPSGDWVATGADCELSSAPSGLGWNGCAVHWSEAERTATVTLTTTESPEVLSFRTSDDTPTQPSAAALAMMLVPATGAVPRPLSGSLVVTQNAIASRSLMFSARLESIVDATTSQALTGTIALRAGSSAPANGSSSAPPNHSSAGGGGSATSCAAAGRPIRNTPALANASEGTQQSYSCPIASGPPANCGTYCAYGAQTCCELQGHPELSCPIGTYCTSDGQCAGSAACATPPGLATTCATSQECQQRNPYLFCDASGLCKLHDGQDCAADSWCAAGSTCETRCGQYVSNPVVPPASSPYPCMCAYGGTTNVYTQSCAQGYVACSDPGKSCCPATTPYLVGGRCYADPYPACEANGGQCPIRCGN